MDSTPLCNFFLKTLTNNFLVSLIQNIKLPHILFENISIGYTVLVSPELMQTVVFPPKIFPLKLKTHTFKFPPIQIFRTQLSNHYFPLHLFPNTFMQTEVKYLAKKEIKQPVIVPSPFMLFSVITTPLQLHFVKTLGFFVWEFVVLQAIT